MATPPSSGVSAAPLPVGTVSLLFTDIEGSTRLWETQAVAMRSALARHDALVRAAIATHAGQVFKTIGDAFCAAFHTAPEAVAAALEVQRALAAEPWPESAPIKVRIALHTGAVELRDHDYFGPPMNRIARLLAAGHGGQTLLTETTYDLARDHLPPLAAVKPLGELVLRDLGRPERVYQLVHPDLVQAFPPLRASASVAPAPSSAGRETPSIAVLPFVNMSRDDENEYFADGLAEELLNVLTKIRGLRVASRTSAFHFKGKDADLPTIAQKLNVATVLEGSVRKAGKRVRITAQLIEVASDSHLWSETYDRELDDIFTVQDDIAQSVVAELRTALLGAAADAEPGAVADAPTPISATRASVAAEVRRANVGRSANPEAYRLYLEGRFHGERVTQADTDRAIELFQRALAVDPGFALAWTGLARAYHVQAAFGFAPIAEGFERARDAARRALDVEPDLAEGHVELGAVATAYDWNWSLAERSIRRALELAPGNASASRAAAQLARTLGRLDEAAELYRAALALDPLSATTHRQAGAIEYFAGRLEHAATKFEDAINLDPSTGLTHAFLAIARLQQGRADEALAIALRESHEVFRNLALAMIQHVRRMPSESDAALAQLTERYGWTAAWQIAGAHAYRNEVDAAFEWLDRAVAQRDPGVGMIASDPAMRALYRDPRWRPLLVRVGLFEAWQRVAAAGEPPDLSG